MTPFNKTFITNRTASEIDDKCGMKFWLSQKEGGKGLVPREEALALRVGRVIHEDLAMIAELHEDQLNPAYLQSLCDDILRDLTNEDKLQTHKMELLYRRLGWIVAWAIFIEPEIRKKWINVAIEKELVLDRSPLWVAVTPDRVLRSREHGYLKYLEYKSTISATKKWLDSWNFAIQLHIGIAAVQEELERAVKFGQIVGLMKGYESAADGRLVHPYVWVYHNQSSNEWHWSYEHGKKAGWNPAPVWEYPEGIVSWVIRCGQEVANSQFPHSAPVFLNSNMLELWVTRRRAREEQIRMVEEAARVDHATRQIYFPMIQSQCRPPFGDPCPYQLACWNATVAANPAGCTDYVPRIPHHDVELIGEGD